MDAADKVAVPSIVEAVIGPALNDVVLMVFAVIAVLTESPVTWRLLFTTTSVAVSVAKLRNPFAIVTSPAVLSEFVCRNVVTNADLTVMAPVALIVLDVREVVLTIPADNMFVTMTDAAVNVPESIMDAVVRPAMLMLFAWIELVICKLDAVNVCFAITPCSAVSVPDTLTNPECKVSVTSMILAVIDAVARIFVTVAADVLTDALVNPPLMVADCAESVACAVTEFAISDPLVTTAAVIVPLADNVPVCTDDVTEISCAVRVARLCIPLTAVNTALALNEDV